MVDRESHSSPADWITHLVDEYEGMLCRYAERILHDRERARDAVQDTFLKLCKIGAPREVKNLKSWLFAVCRNRCLDIMRKEKRMTPVAEGVLLTHPTSTAPPDEAAQKNETDSRMFSIIATMPEAQQEVIRLKFEDGMSYREISRVTGHTVSKVGSHIHAGLALLRRQLAVEA